MTTAVSANITNTVALMTQEVARRYRATCQYEGQRSISELNIKRLTGEMERGTFVQGTPITFCALPDGKLLLVNGNHTLETIARSGIAQTLSIIVLQVRNLDEVAQIYAAFDIHKVRSWANALHAHGLDQEIALAKPVMGAIGLIMQDFRYGSQNVVANSSRDARFSLMRERYRQPAALMEAAIQGAPGSIRKLCLRRAVLGAALELLRYQPSAAFEFWHGLAHDDGLYKGDPRKTLLRYLADNPITGPKENYKQAKCCALAWNAWFRNQELVLLKPNTMDELTLIGTPWGTTEKTERMKPRRDIADLSEILESTGLEKLFETGIQVGPDGASPITLFKKQN